MKNLINKIPSKIIPTSNADHLSGYDVGKIFEITDVEVASVKREENKPSYPLVFLSLRSLDWLTNRNLMFLLEVDFIGSEILWHLKSVGGVFAKAFFDKLGGDGLDPKNWKGYFIRIDEWCNLCKKYKITVIGKAEDVEELLKDYHEACIRDLMLDHLSEGRVEE